MSAQLNNPQVKQNNLAHNHALDPARVGVEANSAVLTVLENGMILDCNKAGAELLGCESSKLTWQPISRLFPQLTDISLLLEKKVNPYLHFLSIAGHHFEAVGLNGVHFVCELVFNAVEELGNCCLRITILPKRTVRAMTLRHLRTY
jgi:nitrogen-specific signal transduction histidine kinase